MRCHDSRHALPSRLLALTERVRAAWRRLAGYDSDSSDASAPRRRRRRAGAGLLLGALISAGAHAQSLSLEPAAGVDPATAWFDGKLYALWRNPGPGGDLEYAVLDGSSWSLQAAVPNANSAVPPSLAAFGGKLYAAWKGNHADQRVWYSVFNGTGWSPQAAIPGATSLGGPALSVSDSKLYAVWKGEGAALASASFDGKRWSRASASAGPNHAPIAAGASPFSPQDIADSALSGVDQGKYGDCVFQAALVATATTAKGQAALSKAIRQNADGSFTVSFAGDPQHPVRVTEDQLITTQVHDKAKWARILEAAIVLGYPGMAAGGHPPAYASHSKAVTGSPAIYALYLLTGTSAAKDQAGSSAIGMRITQAFADGKPVIAYCANNDAGALVSGHEWTVVGYDAGANRITLRNPWGNFKTAGTSKGGIHYDGQAQVSMTMQQFGQFYREVTFGFEKA